MVDFCMLRMVFVGARSLASIHSEGYVHALREGEEWV